MIPSLALIVSILAGGDEPKAEEFLAQALERTRALTAARFRFRREIVNDHGAPFPDSGSLEAEVLFRRERPIGRIDPTAVPIRFRAKGNLPCSIEPPDARGSDGGDAEVAYDGKVLRSRRKGVLFELPLAEARVNVWETAESALLLGGIVDPGLLELHPEGSVEDRGVAKVADKTCRCLELSFPMVKCFGPGEDPAAQGFEPFDAPRGKEPEAAPDPEATLCARVKVRLRVWIAVEDLLVRRIAIPSYGAAAGVTAWQQDTLMTLEVSPAPVEREFLLEAAAGERTEKLSPNELLAYIGTPEQNSEALGGGLIGSAAAEFSLKDPSGAVTKLSALRGKVLLLDFWGTWCGPCVALLPEVQKLHAEFVGRGLVVLGLACNERDPAAPARVMREHGCEYRLLLGGEEAAEAYRVPGYPTLVLVGRDGIVRHVQVGGGSGGAEAKLRTAIEAALGEGKR